MAGGLLNLLANANSNNANTHFIGNPSTCFFYSTFNQFCNFGLQKFRVDYNGSNDLQQNNSTNITFTMPRYGDLLTDTYLVVTLPDIFSPIFLNPSSDISYGSFDFKWIKDIGTNIISEITINIDGTMIQRYSGSYIRNIVERDFDAQKKDIFNKMIGNVPEIHSPNLTTNTVEYPNSFRIYPNTTGTNSYPSIRSRQLFIPINSWFTLSNYLAFPLIALQYQVLNINFTLRPLSELYVIRDLDNINKTDFNLTPYIKPSGAPRHNLATFLTEYEDFITDTTEFNTILPAFKIHLLCTQVFLSEEQRIYFTRNPQSYLFRDVREHTVLDIVGNNRVNIESFSLVASWMWYLQRDDVNERNEWSNYTNLKFENYNINGNLIVEDLSMTNLNYKQDSIINDLSSIFVRPNIDVENEINILQEVAIVCDGAYRENLLPSGVYDYLDFYNKTNGSGKQGLYFYSLALENNRSKIQPSGLFDTNFFNRIEFEMNTLTPKIDPDSYVQIECDDAGNTISITKSNKNLFKYTFTFILQEERYNILSFSSGMATLLIPR